MKFKELITEMEQLVELRDVPVVGWESFQELISWLEEDLGYEFLGKGSYTTVYGKGDYVVKIQRPDLRTNTPPMKCAIRFHRLALKSNNPHFPRVYFVRVYKDKRSVYKYVFGTEKLYPISGTIDLNTLNIPNNNNPMATAILIAFITDYLQGIYLEEAIKLIIELIGPYDQEEYSNEHDRLEMLAAGWKTINHPLIDVYKQVMDLLGDDQCFTDFAHRNTMQRKDGTLVINDPIADDIW